MQSALCIDAIRTCFLCDYVACHCREACPQCSMDYLSHSSWPLQILTETLLVVSPARLPAQFIWINHGCGQLGPPANAAILTLTKHGSKKTSLIVPSLPCMFGRCCFYSGLFPPPPAHQSGATVRLFHRYLGNLVGKENQGASFLLCPL